MHLDLHVSRFDWAAAPAAIGPGLVTLARTAEGVGVRTLSFMDHWFQMDRMAPAEDPMLEGYTALGFVAGSTDQLRLRRPGLGVDEARAVAHATFGLINSTPHSRLLPDDAMRPMLRDMALGALEAAPARV